MLRTSLMSGSISRPCLKLFSACSRFPKPMMCTTPRVTYVRAMSRVLLEAALPLPPSASSNFFLARSLAVPDIGNASVHLHGPSPELAGPGCEQIPTRAPRQSTARCPAPVASTRTSASIGNRCGRCVNRAHPAAGRSRAPEACSNRRSRREQKRTSRRRIGRWRSRCRPSRACRRRAAACRCRPCTPTPTANADVLSRVTACGRWFRPRTAICGEQCARVFRMDMRPKDHKTSWAVISGELVLGGRGIGRSRSLIPTDRP